MSEPAPAATAGPGPYAGLRVLDLSHVVAGPFCTRLRADLGADVIRVERRGGDLMRQTPVYFDEDNNSSAFAQYNGGKRLIGIDLKAGAGREVALKLAAWADVVVENLRPGALDRLGLGYVALRARNPRVIMCSLSTFGAFGPLSELSGFGLVAEAYSGLMDLTRQDDGPPTHFGTVLSDMVSGVHGLAAIGAALYRRAATGEGTHIDISAHDALFSMIDQAPAMSAFTGGQRQMGGYGRRHATSVPSGVARVASGEYVAYGMTGDALFARMAAAMEQPDLLEDDRFATTEARLANTSALYERIEAWAAGFPDAEAMVARMAAFGLTAARVRSVQENLDDPHLRERGALQPVEVDGVGEVLMQTAPYRMAGCTVAPGRAAGRVGADTDAVLRDVLGLDEPAVTNLREAGAVH